MTRHRALFFVLAGDRCARRRRGVDGCDAGGVRPGGASTRRRQSLLRTLQPVRTRGDNNDALFRNIIPQTHVLRPCAFSREARARRSLHLQVGTGTPADGGWATAVYEPQLQPRRGLGRGQRAHRRRLGGHRTRRGQGHCTPQGIAAQGIARAHARAAAGAAAAAASGVECRKRLEPARPASAARPSGPPTGRLQPRASTRARPRARVR